MKFVQVMLVVAAILAAVGIAFALSRDRIENPVEQAKGYQPSGLMEFFGSVVGPRMLSRDELTRHGRAFPSSLRLSPDENMTYTVAPADADRRRASFRISGRSQPLTIIYRADDDQSLDDWPDDENPQIWKQSTADKSHEVSFVIFSKGGKLTFDNPDGDRSSTVTIRMEE